MHNKIEIATIDSTSVIEGIIAATTISTIIIITLLGY